MSTAEYHPRLNLWPILLSAVVLLAELIAVGFIFRHGIDFTCDQNWPKPVCEGASQVMVALYCATAAVALPIILSRLSRVELLAKAGTRTWPLGLNLAGAVIAMLPALFLKEGAGPATMIPAFLCWAVGLGMIFAGLALYLAPLAGWKRFWSDNWAILIGAAVVGSIAPAIAALIRPVWHLDAIAGVTFEGVVWITGVLGYDVEAWHAEKVIGADGFYISVAPLCSGVEGMALITLFVTLYLVLFRSELRFPRALILYPAGLLASALFNVFRITILLIIGIEGNPELAVGGFHSHAGWLMFTLLALAVIGVAQKVSFLRKAPVASAVRTDVLPWHKDKLVAYILPFAVFMLTAVFASTFAENPALAYPLRVLVLCIVVAVFWQFYRALDWVLDPVAIGVGAAVGLFWVLIPVSADAPPYGDLAGPLLVGWFIARGFGTIVLVPLIEEVFFRGYLEKRLRFGDGQKFAILAMVLTAVLFAVLHDRWAEAFAASLAFSYVLARRGRLGDAIISHAVANAIVFGVAVAVGNLALI